MSSTHPRPQKREILALSRLREIRAAQAEPGEVPDGPICLDCRQPVAPEALFCDPCFQARKVVPLEELARRREERRRRTEARLRSVTCQTCGRSDWSVNHRGDAHCRTCFHNTSRPAPTRAGR